ncbi:hypothetical protein FF38_08874 [Lucilia cuprina]|uniref:Uncharacterized protein n=1 Tax=Lucilia cuprina TaxID=7375 RepID=A0A0L0BVQ6_LUCCU|nr:hypothetical protein CVS40_4744 [Lucilia cuprina]KNC24117.1 hypothetical protein FF38_08874 [Lucilia cuprina]
MQYNTLAFWFSLFVTAILVCPSTAFIANAPSVSSSARSSTKGSGNALKDATDIYSLASAQLLMDQVPSGKVSFKPHDLEDVNVRPVYDPGDELLRALNADIAATGQELGTLPMEPDYADTVYNELELASKYDMLRKLQRDIQEEQDLVSKSAVLMKMLEDPTIDTLPIVYVEEDLPVEESNNNNNNLDFNDNSNGMAKRSRYYRRYPWKRHNRNRSTYDPELRYACTPTKEDVFKLLVNLHENRNGKNGKTVSFCNRKRPAKAIFTNIRFLG